ncbi:uncharacterized protein EI90DRAFT_3032960 [Cantharellus anzutake]|uniref:uncharacterized protein n=1 Tax=Cantharellus anzutake TaxID=1750568 RepID=UPI001904CDFE|nr:uncharacterized protein EI90DRAFT_3032960 [Cantharellus anzutake]KAF8342342.1 hypothetical protein EI90DRAFT_3032960 [Cantharellus anzutake]
MNVVSLQSSWRTNPLWPVTCHLYFHQISGSFPTCILRESTRIHCPTNISVSKIRLSRPTRHLMEGLQHLSRLVLVFQGRANGGCRRTLLCHDGFIGQNGRGGVTASFEFRFRVSPSSNLGEVYMFSMMHVCVCVGRLF